jgi:hypothetical protein
MFHYCQFGTLFILLHAVLITVVKVAEQLDIIKAGVKKKLSDNSILLILDRTEDLITPLVLEILQIALRQSIF